MPITIGNNILEEKNKGRIGSAIAGVMMKAGSISYLLCRQNQEGNLAASLE
jgi:hypothetical protein